MSDANLDRGEVEIVLDGKTYVMRPSHEAQAAIEQDLGLSIDELWARTRRFVDVLQDPSAPSAGVGLKLKEMATVVARGIEAARKHRGEKPFASFDVERVAELLAAHRFSFQKPLTDFIVNALFGGAKPEKKDESQATASP